MRSERIKESQYAAKSISNKLMELEAFFFYVTNSKKQTTVHNFFVYIYIQPFSPDLNKERK